ncbi:MAG: bacterioferritin [Candidatus Obscuribacterales bacterium]
MDREDKIIAALNLDLEHEMAAIIRYLHHSFMVKGPLRGPLATLFRTRARESMAHAVRLGEKITAMGGHPSVNISAVPVPEIEDLSEDATIETMIRADLEAEEAHLELYIEQHELVRGNTALRSMIEQFVMEEARHIEELEMYLRADVRAPLEV